MTRRDELLESAADYVLQHGLIGMSLRPLAAALGTSDRMLLYHFTSRDQLVTSIVNLST
jgi:AcrR family transcriptional regulator